MALAMIYPEPEKGGRGRKSTETVGFSAQRLSYARTVLREAPNQAYRVLRGTEKLDAAYQSVMENQGRGKARHCDGCYKT